MFSFLRNLTTRARRFSPDYTRPVSERELRERVQRIEFATAESLRLSLLSSKRYDDPRCLTRKGYKAYSQFDEDGLLDEIFRRIGVTNKFFVEFGVGDGLENNTVYRMAAGWSGVWIEG